MNFQIFKLDLEKAEEPACCQIPNIRWIIKKAREFQKNILFLLYWQCQSLWLYGSQQIVENSERDENTRPSVFWEICMQVKKQPLEPDMEHIRLRPGMYIGNLGDGSSHDDGIYVLIKEVMDNS